MRSFEILTSYREDETHLTAELYENPLWREIVGPLVHWLDLHKPRWTVPGEGGPGSRSNGDGTCTFLWRLRLDLYLGYDFHHDRRKVLHRVRIET